MNFNRFKAIFFIFLALIALGTLGGIFSCVSKDLGIEKAEQKINESSGSFLFAILGGYGSIISDFIWIKAYVYWEQKDLENCIANMDLALAINPNTKTFWTFASSTLAFDSPHWIAEKRGSKNLKQIERIQARKAIKYLERALEYFPNDRGILMDTATIYAEKLEDLKSAIKCYEIICKTEAKLVFTRRTYADLLFRDGQTLKAINILENLLSELNKDSAIYKEISQDLALLKK